MPVSKGQYDHEPTVHDSLLQEQASRPDNKCRDPLFLILFLINLALIAFVAFSEGVSAIRNSERSADGGSEGHSNANLLYALIILAAASAAFSALWLSFMIRYAKDLIQLMLWVSLGGQVIIALLGFIAGSIALALLGVIMAVVTLCYIRAVQPFISFAAAQLKAATAAVKEFWGVLVAAYFCIFLAVVWCVLWSLALVGLVYKFNRSDESPTAEDEDQTPGLGGGVYFLVLVSLYWTLQTIGGIVNCTVSGVVGSWWFIPRNEQKGVVSGSFRRSLTTSLGSICFGSLIVAVLEALRAIAQNAQERENNNNVLACIAACLLSCLENLAQYFNRWAFTYIGIYGFSFYESGKKVFELLERRGLTTIINDNLIGRVLTLGAVMVGLATALAGYVLSFVAKNWINTVDSPSTVLAMAGFVLGFFIADVIMSVVSAAVAAVLICFIEAPEAIHTNHPEYHQLLLQAWSARFPHVLW